MARIADFGAFRCCTLYFWARKTARGQLWRRSEALHHFAHAFHLRSIYGLRDALDAMVTMRMKLIFINHIGSRSAERGSAAR